MGSRPRVTGKPLSPHTAPEAAEEAAGSPPAASLEERDWGALSRVPENSDEGPQLQGVPHTLSPARPVPSPGGLTWARPSAPAAGSWA